MNESERILFQFHAKKAAFQNKLAQSRLLIEQALQIDKACVYLSWGKDSICLVHLCQQILPDIPIISFGHPEREEIANYQEVEAQYCKAFSPNLTTILMAGDHVPAKVNEAKLWEIYPVSILGIRKEESQKRSIAISKYGATYQYKSGVKSGSWRCFPLAFWSWLDVWGYIAVNDLPYLNAYESQTWERGRTTDHFSKNTSKRWQNTRLHTLQTVNPNYYRYLQINHPEMF